MIICPRCNMQYPFSSLICPDCGFSPESIGGITSWAPELSEEADGFKPEYFQKLMGLEKGNFWFRARNSLILWALKKYFPGFSSYFEIGCGTGYVLSGVAKAYPSVAVFASEIFSVGLEFSRKRVPTAQFMQMDARRMPFSEEFDVLAAFDVLEHIEEDELVLENMFRAVKPGGGILLTVPQHAWLWSQADDYACHVRRYSEKMLLEKVERAGFEVIRSTSFVSLLLPLMLLSRLRSRGGREYDPAKEFEIPSFINRFLEWIMGLERAFIRFGCSPAFGGSRMLVARKPSNQECV
ncbi:MAG: class I SAM-dependent methyltransferase [Pseudomonadales bacterium]|nr:class I SAM-dependent methyltransferase [Pseudomonadales bacterium]